MHDPPLILVVDDTPVDALLLSRSVTKAGHQVHVVGDGISAVEKAVELRPDLILLDMTMPGQDGLETCRQLKSIPETANIPVIFVTGHSDTQHVVPAFAAGGCDYVQKPIRVDEMIARISVQLQLRRAAQELKRRNHKLKSVGKQLAQANSELARQSRIDPLTNVLNRRAWDEAAQLEEERSRRHGRTFGVLMIDVDFFKAFNDSLGHQAGDECLRKVAGGIKSACRDTEVVGRYGGEEFVVLAPETNHDGAVQVAERIRQNIWSAAINHPVSPAGRVTVSIGVAASDSKSFAEVLRRADEAMYSAKRCGRNLVCGSDGVIALPSARRGGLPPVPAKCSRSTDDLHEALPTVLIVEDNHTNRKVYRGCLAKEQVQIIEAEHGKAALQLVEKHPPDVIIMDVMMPVMDGLECTRVLKASSETRDIPIIIVSARADAAEIAAGLEAGADEYVTKPIRTIELAARVRSMLRLGRERRDLLGSYRLRAEQIRVLSVLVDLCRAVGTAPTLDMVLEHALDGLSQITLSQRVSAMFPDSEGSHLIIASSRGLDPELAVQVRVPVGQAIAGSVYKFGRPIIVNTEEEAEQYNRGPEANFFASVPLLSAPFGSGGQVLGVLNATGRIGQRPYEPRELEYVDLVAGIVGSTLHAHRAQEARDQARDLILVALARLAEYRDDDTGKHVDRVTQYTVMLARTLQSQNTFGEQLDDRFIRDLARTAPLHDIGKVAVPDSILRKPGRLTVQEMEIMRTHAQIGADLLKPIIEKVPDATFIRMAEQIIRSHHEWYDGSGYPQGLKGDEIPLAARVVALADVYDALTTDRVYRPAVSHDEAVKQITGLREKQFDPHVVDAFWDCLHDFRQLGADLRDVAQFAPKTTKLAEAAVAAH